MSIFRTAYLLHVQAQGVSMRRPVDSETRPSPSALCRRGARTRWHRLIRTNGHNCRGTCYSRLRLCSSCGRSKLEFILEPNEIATLKVSDRVGQIYLLGGHSLESPRCNPQKKNLDFIPVNSWPIGPSDKRPRQDPALLI